MRPLEAHKLKTISSTTMFFTQKKEDKNKAAKTVARRIQWSSFYVANATSKKRTRKWHHWRFVNDQFLLWQLSKAFMVLRFLHISHQRCEQRAHHLARLVSLLSHPLINLSQTNNALLLAMGYGTFFASQVSFFNKTLTFSCELSPSYWRKL